ncbi:quinone oxidoreductase [Roseospira marina]|uniref:Quinone oxidoreductase n=1 Tax=Roseospira marina TaxID=140057 RepID=A0A5M6IE54_9PROT|nr:quinone oxidoreductase [Roseospira marina]KAA5606247.1 quinone oxidoreductase [Roseospira marina]MBB4314401.1 NADPH2:quinone reductase [Roseospira marina]MBB5087561.1 NADPH2:quinone reductase [Roseospira marina]
MTTVHAIRFHETGGPEVLRYEPVEIGDPGAGQVRVRHTAIGLNFIDTYHRSGLYPMPLPSGIGLEAAGMIEAVGEGVRGLSVGDRVAYGTGPIGAYSEARVMAADTLVPLPETVEDQTAAAMMLQGMTVQYLIRRLFPVQPGMTVLFHAAAGGVGLIACQWLKHLGATVIGTVGSPEKAELARAHGCEHTILYRDEDFVARVQEITKGAGVPVVYDGVGKDVFDGSLDCLSRRGMMVTYGNASGPVPEISPLLLNQKGSLFLTRPKLQDYTATRTELVAAAEDLFDVVGRGIVKIGVNQTYPLAEAAQAQRDLEGRKTTGSTVLLP